MKANTLLTLTMAGALTLAILPHAVAVPPKPSATPIVAPSSTPKPTADPTPTPTLAPTATPYQTPSSTPTPTPAGTPGAPFSPGA